MLHDKKVLPSSVGAVWYERQSWFEKITVTASGGRMVEGAKCCSWIPGQKNLAELLKMTVHPDMGSGKPIGVWGAVKLSKKTAWFSMETVVHSF